MNLLLRLVVVVLFGRMSDMGTCATEKGLDVTFEGIYQSDGGGIV